MTGHKAHKSSHLANREIVVSCGNVLGGGSSVNAMIYSRPQRSDFDAWNTLGWSTDDMLPYSKRFETYHGPDSKGLHGADGPIHISGEYRCLGLERDFIDAFDSHGHPQVEDINDMETSNGVMSALRYVNLDGIRQDAATTYIHPRLKDGRHPNLHVIVETEVEMVVLKYNRAIGVKCAPTKTHKSGNSLGSRIIRARKMVVLSAGAMATPLILERSGIGSIDVLERSGVPVVSEVPGVGCNYEDHHNILWGYYSGGLEPCETLDVWLDDRLNYTALQQNISKRLAWNGTDAQCKLRPTDSDVAGLSQAFREVWDRDYEMHSDKPLLIASSVGG
jgi:choline dehydrogenase-like flavoprotein